MKFLLSVLWLTGLVGAASAASSVETADSRLLSVGVEAGLTFSDMNAPEGISTSNRTGFALGVNVDMPITRQISIQPEALFIQRSSSFTLPGNATFLSKRNSIEIPVFVKLRLDAPISPFVFAGPVATFNVSSSVEAETPVGGIAAGFNARNFDYGAAFGVGLDLQPFFATARYTVGISDLNEDSAEWKSRGFNLLAGIRI